MRIPKDNSSNMIYKIYYRMIVICLINSLKSKNKTAGNSFSPGLLRKMC